MYIETNFKIKQKYTLLLYLIHRKSRKIKLTFNHSHNLKGCSKYSFIILLFHIIVFCTIFHRIYQMCLCILLHTILHIIVKTKRNEIKKQQNVVYNCFYISTLSFHLCYFIAIVVIVIILLLLLLLSNGKWRIVQFSCVI